MLYIKKSDNSNKSDGIADRNYIKTEAHKLLRSALIQYGIPENKQEFVYNEYGKPALKENHDLHFNISHCNELAVCAVTKSPVGVDAEKIRNFPERVLKRCFTEREIDFIKKNISPETAFFQLWTLKESYVKAIGKGLIYPLKNAEFIIDNNYITANTDELFSFIQIIIDNEFICSVCCNDIFNNRVFHSSYSDKISYESLMNFH